MGRAGAAAAAASGPATATSTGRTGEPRQDEYLAFATEELTPSSPVNVLAHLTRAERDRHFDLRRGRHRARRLRRHVRQDRRLPGHQRLRPARADGAVVGPPARHHPGAARRDRAAVPRLPLLVHRPAARRCHRQQVVLVGEPPDHLPHPRVPRRPGAAARDVHDHRPDRARPRRPGARSASRPGSTRRPRGASRSGTATSTTRRTSRR